jgi:hypothetical protein
MIPFFFSFFFRLNSTVVVSSFSLNTYQNKAAKRRPPSSLPSPSLPFKPLTRLESGESFQVEIDLFGANTRSMIITNGKSSLSV